MAEGLSYLPPQYAASAMDEAVALVNPARNRKVRAWRENYFASTTAITEVNTLTGAGSLLNGAYPRVAYLQQTSGATATSQARALGPALTAGAYPSFPPSGTTADWALVMVYEVTTTPDANAIGGIGSWSGGAALTNFCLGMYGSASTTKFVARGAGNALVSTVSIDAAMHRLRFWRLNGVGYLQVDNEAVQSSANVYYAPGADYFVRAITNGATAAAQTHRIYDIGYAMVESV